MANVELVIKIDEKLYNYMKTEGYDEHMDRRFDYQIRHAVKNGTLLSKGHGKIGDIDELQTMICNKSASISDLTILKGVYFALQVIEDYVDGSRTWIADIPFVTGMSTDADKPIPECETWSDDQNPIEIKYGEKNLVKSDCAHCGESVYYTKINGEVLLACPLSKCKYEAETVMNCIVCKHRKLYKVVDNTGRVIRACNSQECNFERW